MPFCFCLLFQATSNAQVKGDNLITVDMPDSTTAFKTLRRVLVEQGYTTKTTDAELQSLSVTLPIESMGSAEMTVNAYVKGSNIFLFGSYKVDAGSFATSDQIKAGQWGSKGAPARNTWDKLEAIAKALGGQVYYGKR